MVSRQLFQRAWNMSMADLVRILGRRYRRLTGSPDQRWDYSLRAVLQSQKHMDPKMEIERWERLWRLATVQGHAHLTDQFRFSNKSVLEVGCGPVLGIGPMALFLGADMFYYREPSLQREATNSCEIKERYFRRMYAELIANYGQRHEFAPWYSRVMEQCAPIHLGARDICHMTVSQSVLEHIPRASLGGMLADLRAATKSGGVGMHLVDFGPHGFDDGTLMSLYRRDRAIEPAGLNLLRKSDLESAFSGAGFELLASLVYKADDVDRSQVHVSWRACSDADLCTRVAVFLVGNAASASGVTSG